MQPDDRPIDLPVLLPFRTGTLKSRADPVEQVLDWLGRANFFDNAHSSSSNPTSNNNTGDVICGGKPVFDARRFDGAWSQLKRPSCLIQHDSGHDAMHQHFVGSGMAHSSTAPSNVFCEPAPPAKSFTKDGHPARYVDTRLRDYILDEQTARWDQRQQRSGAIGRLVIYDKGQSPKEDIHLRGGGHHHIVIVGCREGGQAARAGVKVGDRLVSIDGKKDLLALQAEAVQERLEAPVLLVFLGFVGKLEAEVRLKAKDQVCGISSREEAVQGMDGAPLQLCEERVLDVGTAPLFLAVMPSQQSKRPMQQSDEDDKGEEKEEDEDEDKKSREEVDEAREDGTLCEKSNGQRGVHSIHSNKQERQPAVMLIRQTKVTRGRTPGHSTSRVNHILEVAPCFELQQSEFQMMTPCRGTDLQGIPLTASSMCDAVSMVTSMDIAN